MLSANNPKNRHFFGPARELAQQAQDNFFSAEYFSQRQHAEYVGGFSSQRDPELKVKLQLDRNVAEAFRQCFRHIMACKV